MANTTITQGSKEFFIASVVDLLGSLTDLTGTSPVFDVWDFNVPPNHLMTNVAVSQIVGMSVYCLVDTSTGSGLVTPVVPVNGWWAAGDYRLYLKFTTGVEVPRLGPFHFTVDAS